MKRLIWLPFLAMIAGVLSFSPLLNSRLTASEKDALLFMFEEEKLARDVYDLMFDKWGSRQFDNIRQSERRHMQVVEELLKKYSIPYSELKSGKFADKSLQDLYDTLSAKGITSEAAAFRIATTIEDVDIYDLDRLGKTIKNQHIKEVFGYLKCGSKNHMRAFLRGLNRYNETYTPQFISSEKYESIINAGHSPCGKMQY